MTSVNAETGQGHTWGATVLENGGVRFRLWAPAQREIALVLGGRALAMRPGGDGWFELETDLAGPGDAYLFRLADGTEIADPASRAQVSDVEGPSLVVDHSAYRWRAADWKGRPWAEAVIYELHVGTFTPEGTFLAAREHLPHLRALGVTAVEIMPVAHFAGVRGWGYDGVLHYAPHRAYGTPDDLKAFVDAAHEAGLMVFLDVVYNHFGPVGNRLPGLAPAFFDPERATPWGASVAFEQPAVRRYFIENALQWVCDYRFDGLRLDAIEEIADRTEEHFLLELAGELRASAGERELHLVVEDQMSRRGLLRRSADGTARHYTAGWNDEFHHALHVVATGETKGHYAPFARDPYNLLRKAVAEGFATADPEKDTLRPVPDGHLPPSVNVNFLQNHDQVGNRAFGERLSTLVDPALLDVVTALLMLTPATPLVFMGEEYGERRPFHFFADFEAEIAHATRLGRQAEAENFGGLPPGRTVDELPDPAAEETFRLSRLDWPRAATEEGRRHMARLRALVDLRRQVVVPLLAKDGAAVPRILPAEDGVLAIDWAFADATLQVRANLAAQAKPAPPLDHAPFHAVPDVGVRPGEPLDLPGPSLVVAVSDATPRERDGARSGGRDTPAGSRSGR